MRWAQALEAPRSGAASNAGWFERERRAFRATVIWWRSQCGLASASGDILDQFDDGPAHLAVIELAIGAQQLQCAGNGKELKRGGRRSAVTACDRGRVVRA